MTVTVCLPRGFSGGGRAYVPRPRNVVEEMPGAIRLHRASSQAEAAAVRDAWRRNDYSQWPGQVRIFEEQP